MLSSATVAPRAALLCVLLAPPAPAADDPAADMDHAGSMDAVTSMGDMPDATVLALSTERRSDAGLFRFPSKAISSRSRSTACIAGHCM